MTTHRARTTLAALTSVGLLAALVATAPWSSADTSGTAAATAEAVSDARRAEARALLQQVRDVLSPAPAPAAARGFASAAEPRDATLLMAQLTRSLGDLTEPERKQALALLARPTDSPDPQGEPWSGPEAVDSPYCTSQLCVHWTDEGADAPDLADADSDNIPDWVETTTTTLSSVWSETTGTLGYREPLPDVHSANYDGDDRFDVYLSQLTDSRLYGYCAPDDERALPGSGYAYYALESYCVLDDNFMGYGVPPVEALRVTAGHEFFHAVQFAYDAYEDSWLMESTATWMEEVLYDGINDNRQYLDAGALGRPGVPLDRSKGGGQYGQWIFWQFLEGYVQDRDVVREVWNEADGSSVGPDRHSVAAISEVLETRGLSFGEVFGDFAAYNDAPDAFYPEGGAYDRPDAYTAKLRKGTGSGWLRGRFDHLSSGIARFKPSSNGPAADRLVFTLDLPSERSAARLVVRFDDGRIKAYRVDLNGKGNAKVSTTFKRSTVTSVDLVVVNTSRRYTCWTEDLFACQGTPIDDAKVFDFKAVAS